MELGRNQWEPLPLNPKAKTDPSPRPSPLRKGRGGTIGNSLANRGSWAGEHTDYFSKLVSEARWQWLPIAFRTCPPGPAADPPT
jgi:hypothetical protein